MSYMQVVISWWAVGLVCEVPIRFWWQWSNGTSYSTWRTWCPTVFQAWVMIFICPWPSPFFLALLIAGAPFYFSINAVVWLCRKWVRSRTRFVIDRFLQTPVCDLFKRDCADKGAANGR